MEKTFKNHEFDVLDIIDKELLIKDLDYNFEFFIPFDNEDESELLDLCIQKRAEWIEENNGLIYSGF